MSYDSLNTWVLFLGMFGFPELDSAVSTATNEKRDISDRLIEQTINLTVMSVLRLNENEVWIFTLRH